MATIKYNSPIKVTTGTLNLNNSDFSSKLFFDSSVSTYNYIIIRDNYVIAKGILSGYNNNTNYDYRFDFNDFIKIDNQNEIILNNIDLSGCMTFDSKCSCNLSLLIDTTDIISQNITAGHLVLLSNGQVSLVGGHTIEQLICDNLFNYKFIDKDDDSVYKFETIITKTQDTFISITIYSGYTFSYSLQYVNITPTEISNSELSVTAGYDRKTFLINTSNPANLFNWTIYNSDTEQTLISDSWVLSPTNCYNQWYFYNPNGTFDTIKTTGNLNEISNITKDTIKVGDKIINTNIVNNKQIKQNTGFSLTDSQIKGLIYSPYIYTLDNVDNYINPNLFNDSLMPEFETSYGTITKMPAIGEEEFMRFVPYGYVFGLNGFPFTYYDGFNYYMSMYLRSDVDIQIRFGIDVIGQVVFNLLAHQWKLCTFPIIPSGSFTNSILYLASNESCTLDFKKLKLEFGSQPSEWSPSVYDSPAKIKEYTIDNKIFDGYNGKKLSQKNIELLFNDPKSYKRKTNYTTNFFD